MSALFIDTLVPLCILLTRASFLCAMVTMPSCSCDLFSLNKIAPKDKDLERSLLRSLALDCGILGSAFSMCVLLSENGDQASQYAESIGTMLDNE